MTGRKIFSKLGPRAVMYTWHLTVCVLIHTHIHPFNGRYQKHTHTHPFNGPFSRTTRVGRYQKGKTNTIWILLKQDTVSGSGISWAICKSEHRSRQITMPAPHHSVFYRPDALPAAQPTASKHRRQIKALKAERLNQSGFD